MKLIIYFLLDEENVIVNIIDILNYILFIGFNVLGKFIFMKVVVLNLILV